MTLSVGVVGASGYAGAELLRLVAAHPSLELAWATGGRSAGERFAALYPGLSAAYGDLVLWDHDRGLDAGADLVVLALPHGQAAAQGARAGQRAQVVVDLSADFRLLDPADYVTWYGGPHPDPAQLGAWTYGLVELHREALSTSKRVAAPGCYPTASLLALAPLVAAGLIQPEGIVVDAKSGVSGAGRALRDGSLFGQVNESVAPYNVGAHRHTPEIEQELGRLTGARPAITFTPHLVPMTRGLLATCYARPSASLLEQAQGDPAAVVRACMAATYDKEVFVEFLGTASGGAPLWPQTRALLGTNRAHVGAGFVERTGMVVSACAIDNLGKGAAGQALQAANVALGLGEREGLELIAPVP